VPADDHDDLRRVQQASVETWEGGVTDLASGGACGKAYTKEAGQGCGDTAEVAVLRTRVAELEAKIGEEERATGRVQEQLGAEEFLHAKERQRCDALVDAVEAMVGPWAWTKGWPRVRAAVEAIKDARKERAARASGRITIGDPYYVKHRTAQETSGSGYRPPDDPWTYDGPFNSYDEASVHWDAIRPNWQEGCVVTKCGRCGDYTAADLFPKRTEER
jgi:hypothetical protein